LHPDARGLRVASGVLRGSVVREDAVSQRGRIAEAAMEIAWRRDADKVLADAAAQGRHVLFDFSAAPA